MGSTLLDRLFMAQVASCGCLTKTPEVSAHAEDCTYRILNEAQRRIELLESALRFYAHGHHFFGDKDSWDTVSGEPQNFWCNEAGDATVEDGSIAKKFLLGEWQDWGGHEAPDLLQEERAGMETPADLVGALQDKVHADSGPFRAGRAAKETGPSRRDKLCASCKGSGKLYGVDADNFYVEKGPCEPCGGTGLNREVTP